MLMNVKRVSSKIFLNDVFLSNINTLQIATQRIIVTNIKNNHFGNKLQVSIIIEKMFVKI